MNTPMACLGDDMIRVDFFMTEFIEENELFVV